MQPEPLRGSMWCGSRLRLHPCMPDSICAWCVLPGHPCGSRLRLHPCMPDSMCAWCVLPGHPTVLRSSQTTDPNKPSPTILGICRKIVAEDGFAGFFRGWWAQILALGASNFIFFYSSSMIKVLVRSRRGVARLDPITNLMVGAVAGVINVMMTTPLWGVMTVLTVQRKRGTKDGVEPYKGMLDGLVRCGREEGVAGQRSEHEPHPGLQPHDTLLHLRSAQDSGRGAGRGAQASAQPVRVLCHGRDCQMLGDYPHVRRSIDRQRAHTALGHASCVSLSRLGWRILCGVPIGHRPGPRD
jgi:hypothetical protein